MPVANIAFILCMIRAGGTSHVCPPTSNTSWSTSAAQPVASPNDRQQSTARTGCDCGVDTLTPGQRTIQFLENAQLPLSHRRSPIAVPSAACQASHLFRPCPVSHAVSEQALSRIHAQL
ncbi:hypothetical protein BS50DRAFT_105049 [Corynespora cassiicola Philippines]|uniref:Secreted protein n=1 Tax=Corynespora cassiicola Philippines TaxID=1448308 RepID=A0A2T2NCH1_CORCC|nr:hypothetical protein BS50DRAFT_105049 [Corynespora cassiicola Philippines]